MAKLTIKLIIMAALVIGACAATQSLIDSIGQAAGAIEARQAATIEALSDAL